MRDNEKLIYVPEFMMVLIAMDENKNVGIMNLHYKFNISYSVLHNMKKIFIEKNWITITRDGKVHIPNITDKGRDVLNSVYNLLKVLEINKDDLFAFKVNKKTRETIKPILTYEEIDLKDMGKSQLAVLMHNSIMEQVDEMEQLKKIEQLKKDDTNS